MTETEMEKHRNARGGEGVVCVKVCVRERALERVCLTGGNRRRQTLSEATILLEHVCDD